MFEVQLFGNEFIMISTDKRFDSRPFPFWRSPGFELASLNLLIIPAGLALLHQ